MPFQIYVDTSVSVVFIRSSWHFNEFFNKAKWKLKEISG